MAPGEKLYDFDRRIEYAQNRAVIERENDVYVATCPELSIASHGDSIDEARAMPIEALEGWFETAGPSEIAESLPSEIYIEKLELAVA